MVCARPMSLQVKANRWGCMTAAFAMALDVKEATLIELIGHDGGELFAPFLPEPRCRKGVHVQECVLAAMSLGYSVTPFQLLPQTLCNGVNYPIFYNNGDFETNRRLFDSFILGTRGVIECNTLSSGHAVAFHNGIIFDPDGEVFPYTQDCFESRSLWPRCLWRVEQRGA